MPAKRDAIQVSFRLARELYDWVQEHSGEGRKFHNLTHAVERGLRILKREHEGQIRVVDQEKAADP